MPLENNFGLVLRIHDAIGYKISLLDKVHGRFDALLSRKVRSLCNGAIVRYSFEMPTGILPRLSNIEQLHAPFAWVHEGLAFIHHLLEICLHCIPVGAVAPEVVDILVMVIYKIVPQNCTQRLKKIIILKMLISIGIISDQINIYYTHIELCLTTPLDNIESLIDQVDEDILQEVILSCLQAYMPINRLRTMTALLELHKNDT